MRSPRYLFAVLMVFAAGCRDKTEPRSFSEALPVQAGIARPVINEIMYEPLQQTGDGIPDQPEYVEIYNPGIVDVNLSGWKIVDRDNNVRALSPAIGSWNLGPGKYGVIAPEASGIFATSRLAVYFSYLAGVTDAAIFFVGTRYSSLSLNNEGDSIRLVDNNNVVVDRVDYTPAWHNPAIKGTTARISLEKFNPLLPSDSPLSWSSCTDTEYGGTPGKANSIYMPPSRSGEMLRMSPNPFSPDGDLRDDQLQLTVSLPAGSYQLSLTVYDALGSEVRHLASGTPAGPVALLFWDGRSDGGAPLPAGAYRIVMNAAGANGSRYGSAGNATLAR